MKVILNKNNKVLFSDLKDRETFIHEGLAWVKLISAEIHCANAIDFTSFLPGFFTDDHLVTRATFELRQID